jgi:dihydropyrimidine dehydrogenase (NAD+) subunit PreT
MSLEHNYGKIIVESGCKTNIQGVFAGGDNVNGGREVVDAVQAGKEAAAEMLREMLKVEC